VKGAEGPDLRHLSRLAGRLGLVEHARLDEPDPEEGYCTDDAGRLLAVIALLPADAEHHRLSTIGMRFLEAARDAGAVFRLRRGPDGRWTDDAPSDDAVGRAIQGLGEAAATSPWLEVRSSALVLFESVEAWRSTHPRAMSHAALGAVAVLSAFPDHAGAHRLVDDAADVLPSMSDEVAWRWPEARLTYSNALLPEAELAVSIVRGDEARAWRALNLLDWLAEEESLDGHFSFAPVGGRSAGDEKPGFDQQPIEAWAMADACTRAYLATREPKWANRVSMAASWFAGDNDLRVPMSDRASGASFDGLTPAGPNLNQGAESTLALVATMARVAEVKALRRQERWLANSVHGALGGTIRTDPDFR
jgi:hypothetical protein